jgi:ABC-type lipoprotein release transport system permease subunit
MILKLTWRNLWRNRRRTFITMTSVAFAVVLAVVMKSLQKGVFDNLIKNVVSFYSGYLQVHKDGYWDEQVIENSFIFQNSLTEKIRGTSGVLSVVPRIETYALASAGSVTKGCLVCGTDPLLEDQLTHLGQKIFKGSYFSRTGESVMIAEKLAKKLQLTVNDTLVLLGQGYQGSVAAAKYPVAGILRFGSPELNESMVYLQLSAAQVFLGAEGRITSLALGIDDPLKMSKIQQGIVAITGENYEVMNWTEMMPDIENHMRADSFSFYIWIGILYLIIAFGIFSTILMMTAERMYEFGMLIAIGMKKMRLGLMLLSETIMITVMGTLIGLVLAVPPVWYFREKPIRISGNAAAAYEQFGFEPIFPTVMEVDIFITQALIVLIMTLIIGLYPVWNVSRIDPVKAMKK